VPEKGNRGPSLQFIDRDDLGRRTLKQNSERSIAMKSGTRDEAEGQWHQVKGKVKEIAGELSDDPIMEAEGTNEKIAGKVQEKIGQVKKVVGK
jgi:uncharacterized protein YjbJ (UPF0337 family)